MAFEQFRLDRSVNQTRNIFDKYIYETGDTIADVTAPAYFLKSRFSGRSDWLGGVIECECGDGYIIGRIGGDASTLEEILNADSYQRAQTPFIVTDDRTTEGDEVLTCTNTAPIDITLNLTPLDLERVTVKRTDALVSVLGAIDGDTVANIGAPRNSVDLVYITDLNEWVIV